MEISIALDNCGHALSSFVFFIKSLFGSVLMLLVKMNFRDPRKLLGELEKREGCVIRARIVWRRKLVLTKAASHDDFLLWSQNKLSSLDILLKQNVSLYSITPDFVTFVRTPPGTNCHRSETSPFFYLAQFFNAEEVYVTSHHWFHVLTSSIADECRMPATWLWNTGRCGSTMISQIMESVPGTVGFSEPDAIENIAHMAVSDLISSDQKQSLLRSTICILVYHAKTQVHVPSSQDCTRHVFIKPRAVCNMLIRDVHKICPEIRHVFMYRRLNVVLQSFREVFGRIGNPWVMLVDSDRVAAMAPFFRQCLFKMLFFGSDEDKEPFTDLVHKLSVLGIIATKVCTHLKMVQNLQAEGFSIPALLYEDILADPTATVGSLFDYMQLSREHLDTALRSMSRTSQSSVPHYTNKKQSSKHHITARERQEVDTILARLQLPKMDDDIVFSQQIGHE